MRSYLELSKKLSHKRSTALFSEYFLEAAALLAQCRYGPVAPCQTKLLATKGSVLPHGILTTVSTPNDISSQVHHLVHHFPRVDK